MKKTLLTFYTILLCVYVAKAQFIPDPTFGINGLARTTVTSYKSVGTDAVVQADGKIVAIGYSYQDIDDELERNHTIVSRYKLDGTFDFGFGPQNLGRIGADSGSYQTTEENFVRMLPDGKIIAAVIHQPFPGSQRRIQLIRYTDHGFIDHTFGQQGGRILLGYSGEANFYLAGFEVLPDGKLLLGCHFFTNTSDFALMRINANGTPDTTFGPEGLRTYNFGNANNTSVTTNDAPRSMKVLSDGKILLGGYVFSTTSNDTSFALLRLNANGTVDTTFGQNGRVTTNFGSGQATINALAIDTDSKIYASGAFYNYNTSSSTNIIARYLANGTIDVTFGQSGKVMLTTTVPAFMSGSVIQPDGKLLMTGYSLGITRDFALLRCNTDGTPDTTFGTLGLMSFDFGANETGKTVRFQPDGKLVIVGTYENGSTRDIAILRINTGFLSSDTWEETRVRFFPNPFTDTITLEGIISSDTIIVYDSLGRNTGDVIVTNKENATQVTLPQDLSPGIYHLQMNVAGKLYQIKLVKK